MKTGVRNPLLSDFSRSFQSATGLPLHFHEPGQFQVGEEEGLPDFCRVMAMNHKICQSCVKTHTALQDPDGREVRTARCFAGLTSSAVPVVRSGKPVGYLHTGHVYVDRNPGCAQPGRGCMLPGRKERRCACAGACLSTPNIPASKYEGALQLIRLFSEQLAGTLVPNVSVSSYSVIQNAVRLIRQDVTREWSLREIAASSGMHHGYFSEQFHLHTGLTLTDFLATLRIEKARRLLEFTTISISEVAFASGFRSISQFNRVFKARTGFPPGELRKARCPKLTQESGTAAA